MAGSSDRLLGTASKGLWPFLAASRPSPLARFSSGLFPTKAANAWIKSPMFCSGATEAGAGTSALEQSDMVGWCCCSSITQRRSKEPSILIILPLHALMPCPSSSCKTTHNQNVCLKTSKFHDSNGRQRDFKVVILRGQNMGLAFSGR